MNLRHRPKLLLAVLLSILGCAAQKEYTPPPRAVLQDPLPGKGLLYLFRAPYDQAAIELQVDDARVILPAERYTVLSLQPGQHTLRTIVKGGDPTSPSDAIPTLAFAVSADERLGFFLPAPERRSTKSMAVVPGAQGVYLPVLTQRMEATGASRAWTFATREDFNWFSHYTKLYLP